ncbi:MAG: carboxypeptidase-like regulatory domain-containing protein, partial [Gemmatimonadota bacterium]
MRLHTFVRSGVLAALALFFAAGAVYSQATTGSGAGVISEEDGSPIAGATVTFTHQPTGFTSTATTNERGAFRIQGLEPGGPYRVEVASIGFRPHVREDVTVGLGQTYNVTTSLEETAVELEALLVETDALANQFSSGTQGTVTTIGAQQLEELPALDRRFENLARLTPQIVASDVDGGLGLSVVGQNNHYNT